MYNIVDADDIKKNIAEYEKLDKTIPIFDDAEYIVAECDGEKKGYIVVTEKGNKFILEKLFIVTEKGNKFILEKLFIKKEERYKAYGSKLVNFFINYARKSKKDVIIYEGEDKKIKSFLRKFGFKEIKGKFLIETVEKDSRKKEGAFVALGSVFLNIFLAGIKIFGGIKGKKLVNFFINYARKSKKDVIIYEGEDKKIKSFLRKFGFKEIKGKFLIETVEKDSRKKEGAFVALGSVFLNIFLAGIKIFGGIKGKSNALVADGFNSLSDVVSSAAILLGIHFSNMPEDEDHPYGHEKIESIIGIMVGLFVVITAFEIGSSAAILLGIHFSNMPEDEDHPYGHEKIESIIGIMVGLFVVITAFEIGRGAVTDLLKGVPKTMPSFSTIYLALISAAVKYGMYFYKMKVGKATKNVALIADARDSKSDVFSSLGVIIGILLSIYVSPIFDTVVSLIVAATKNVALIADARDSKSDVFSSLGVIIGILLSIYVSPIFDTVVSLIVAALILKDSKSDVFSSLGVIIGILLSIYVSPIFDTVVSLIVAALILKEGLSTIFETSNIILDKQEEDFIKEIEEYIYNNTDIKNVHEIYMRRSGDKIFLSFHIRLDKNTTVYKAHHISDALEQSIMMDFKEVKEVMIHIDYLMD